MTLFFQPGSTRDQLVSGVSILKPDRLKQVAAAESIKKDTWFEKSLEASWFILETGLE